MWELIRSLKNQMYKQGHFFVLQQEIPESVQTDIIIIIIYIQSYQIYVTPEVHNYIEFAWEIYSSKVSSDIYHYSTVSCRHSATL